jgi:YD repeat-containing protein
VKGAGFDLVGWRNLTFLTDANSNQTAFTYDAFGRATQTNFLPD